MSNANDNINGNTHNNINDKEKLFEQGVIYYRKGDKKQAEFYWQQSAEKGLAEAQFNLAQLYCEWQHFEKALHYYQLSAGQKHINSQVNLAILYLEGKGTKVDKEKGIYWLKEAAELQSPEALENLGHYYRENDDYETAIDYYFRASSLGNPEAQFSLGVLASHGMGIEQNDELAQFCYEQAAAQDHVEACLNLGAMYMKGQGVEKNYSLAAHYFQKAAAQNNLGAMLNLGALHFLTQDYSQAVFWYQKVLERDENCALANFNLGVLFQSGMGVEKDDKKAYFYYQKAAQLNHVKAQYNLGIFYHHENNYSQALFWLEKAANQGFEDAKLYLRILKEELKEKGK